MPKRQSLGTIDTIDNIRGDIIVTDFSGGLNTVDSNEILADNEAIVRKNWGQASKGAIEKVNGYTKKNSTTLGAKPIRGLFRVYTSNGTRHLLAICNGTLKYSTDGGTNFSSATGGTGLTETVFNTGVNYNDLFFFTNGTDNLYHYTPTTTTMAAATSRPTDACKILLKRSDRRFLALVNATNGSTLYFSKIDPTGAAADDWSATNDAGSIAIDGAKSEALTGGMTFGSVDIIFKDYAAFKVWGYPSPQAYRLPGSPGCAAPYSVAQGDGLGFHLGHDGVYMYDGNKFICISDPIDDIIDSINSSYVQNAFGVYRDGYYWLFYTVSGQTTHQDCVIYDVFRSNPYVGKNVWFERDSLSMNCPLVFSGTGDDNELYAGASGDTGFVYRLDFSSTGADDTSNIAANYQTKYFNGGYPNLVKRFSRIYIRYKIPTTDMTVTWYTNKGNVSNSFTVSAVTAATPLGEFVLDEDTLGSEIESDHVERVPDNCIGKDISLKFSHTGTGTAPIVRDIQIEWEGLYQE